MVRAICSDCNASFYLNLETIQEEVQKYNLKINEGVEIHCPHCNAIHMLRLEDNK